MPEPSGDTEFVFDGAPDQYPDDWLDPAGRIKSKLRLFSAQQMFVRPDGVVGVSGHRAWFLPGKFRCLPGLQGPATASGARDQ
jgi:hypothetical protein